MSFNTSQAAIAQFTIALQTKYRKIIKIHEIANLNLNEGNTKPLFAHINKAKGQSNYTSSLKDINYEQIPEELAKHFASVYNDHIYIPPVFKCKPFDPMAAINISEAGVKSYLSSLDPRKSSGPDDVSPMLLKMFSLYVPSFVCCISTLFQASLQGGKLPNIWKSSTSTSESLCFLVAITLFCIFCLAGQFCVCDLN